MISYFPTSSIDDCDCHIIPTLSMFVFIKQYNSNYYKILIEYGFIPAYKICGCPSMFNEKTARIANCYNRILFDCERIKKVNLKSRLGLFIEYY